MKEGDLCILSPGVIHYLDIFDDDTAVINILIRRSTFEDVFRNILPNNNILSFFFLDNLYHKEPQDALLFRTGNDAVLRRHVLEMLLEFENKSDYFSTILNSRLITFLGLLLRTHGDDYSLFSADSSADVRSYEMIRFMQEHYRDADLAAVAEHFHYSNEYTSRLIKKICGMNFTEFQKKLRMEQACLWLQKTDLPVSVVSENVGYLNVENFNRAFKKVFGLSPKAWRNEHQS